METRSRERRKMLGGVRRKIESAVVGKGTDVGRLNAHSEIMAVQRSATLNEQLEMDQEHCVRASEDSGKE